MTDAAIEAIDLTRRFGDRTAVDTLNLLVEPGTVHALLGPSGSGKTTIVRMLATLLRPTAGTARVLGADVVRDADLVRRRIGLIGQDSAVDPRMTGVENLRMIARLGGLSRTETRRAIDDLPARFGLADAAHRLVSTWSGGMRRRLDIACAVVASPAVLFLDEPTTGLDPRNRRAVHDHVRGLVAGGTAVLLTTQYLDEAARLADAVTIVDRGVVVATGAPDAVVRRAHGCLDVELVDAAEPDGLEEVIAALGGRRALPAPGATEADTGSGVGAGAAGGSVADRITFEIPADLLLVEVVRALDRAGIVVRDLDRRRPTLDDAFLAATERTAP
ncbi:ABC transporter ATP-binding protein [Millisia brevis]|uniref:ABC transporter ATP-binding protein n=1 Tax=Millisia brevis TaxID=264148 RepID=UPI000835C1D1|nr:ATP-binding cassette domain-containing protein [Millisia brevis]